jgi:hypothetical protein
MTDLECTRQANQAVEKFLHHSSELNLEAFPNQAAALNELRAALESMRPVVRNTASSYEDELRSELALYRQRLERLHRQLQTMETFTESARTQIQLRLGRLRATQSWCAAARNTT